MLLIWPALNMRKNQRKITCSDGLSMGGHCVIGWDKCLHTAHFRFTCYWLNFIFYSIRNQLGLVVQQIIICSLNFSTNNPLKLSRHPSRL